MYAIKTEVPRPRASGWTFSAQKTMYGGKHIAVGDLVYVFASENEGGAGLVARGVVTAAAAVPLRAGVERQTPRVDIVVRRTGLAARPLGRRELKAFCDWDDGRPETELNFKFYRQATDKIVGLSDDAAAFLAEFFEPAVAAAPSARRASRQTTTLAAFEPGHIAAARALWAGTEGVGLSAADEPGPLARYIARNPRTSFVAMRGGRLVGTLLCGHDGRRGLLHHLAVAEDCRRAGLGRRLVDAGLRALNEEGIAKCHVLVFADNPGGQAFWAAVGAQRRDELRLLSMATGLPMR